MKPNDLTQQEISKIVSQLPETAQARINPAELAGNFNKRLREITDFQRAIDKDSPSGRPDSKLVRLGKLSDATELTDQQLKEGADAIKFWVVNRVNVLLGGNFLEIDNDFNVKQGSSEESAHEHLSDEILELMVQIGEDNIGQQTYEETTHCPDCNHRFGDLGLRKTFYLCKDELDELDDLLANSES